MTCTQEDINSWLTIPLGQEVIDLLTPVSDEPDFICGALAFCNTQEMRAKLINEIKTKNLNTFQEISHTVNEIAMGRI